MTDVSRALIAGIDGTLSLENETVCLALLDHLQYMALIDKDSLVGSDGEEGLSIRWPEARMFCEVWDGMIRVSVVQSNCEVSRKNFAPDKFSEVGDEIARILRVTRLIRVLQ